MRILSSISDALDSAELGVLLVLSTALGIALLVGIPTLAAWILYRGGQSLAGSLVVAAFALCVAATLRDLRARRLSWFTAGLGAVWALCTVCVGISLLLG